jgi:hypothetical protein
MNTLLMMMNSILLALSRVTKSWEAPCPKDITPFLEKPFLLRK